jgi:hypothetical protein
VAETTVGGRQVVQAVASATPEGRLPPASSKAMVCPARPAYGTVGRRFRVRANHFLVQLADKEIYHYDVCISQSPIQSLSLSLVGYTFEIWNRKYSYTIGLVRNFLRLFRCPIVIFRMETLASGQ